MANFVESRCLVGGDKCPAWSEWFWASVETDPACNDEDRDPDPLLEWPFNPLACERPDLCRHYRDAVK